MVDLDSAFLTPLSASVTPLVCGFFYNELIKSIDGASLFICSIQYQWKWNIHERQSKVQQLGAAIARARRRNVAVNVILNQEAPKHHLTVINRVTGDQLSRLGCQVRQFRPGALIHTKLWIIDGRQVFIGSHNISGRSLSANEETSVKIESVEVAKVFKLYFDRLWRA